MKGQNSVFPSLFLDFAVCDSGEKRKSFPDEISFFVVDVCFKIEMIFNSPCKIENL